MTDKLKLADPKGDAELEKTVIALELEEQQKRLGQVTQNVANLEKALADKKKADAAKRKLQKSAKNKIGARKDASFKAISTAPSINKTPIGRAMVPVPYPVVQDLSGSVNASRSVRFNGKPAYLLDQSTQPSCTGDARGTGKGVKSGTVSGEVKPVAGSRSVRIEGKQVVREGDPCTMNGGNNPGTYVTTQTPSPAPPKDAIKTSNPPMIQEQPSYPAALQNIAKAYKADKIGLSDAISMAWDNTKFYFDGSQAAQGAAQVVGGALEVLGATGMALSGVGAVVGIPLAFHGGDNIGTGISRIFRDEPQQTLTHTGVEALTGSTNIAQTVDKAIPFLGGVVSAAQGIKILPSNSTINDTKGGSYQVTLTYKPSSGVTLQAQPNKTTTVLGSYNNDMRTIINELSNVKSTDFGPRIGGFNALNVPDNLYVSPKQFWADHNQPWLLNAIKRQDNFLIATPPAFDVTDIKSGFGVLARPNPTTGQMELSGFGREYLEMRRAGYTYKNGKMER